MAGLLEELRGYPDLAQAQDQPQLTLETFFPADALTGEVLRKLHAWAVVSHRAQAAGPWADTSHALPQPR